MPVEVGQPQSWRFMAKTGISMLFHDRLKLAGTLAGVVFAVLMSNFQASIFFALLLRNTMYVDRSDAAIWIVPPGTQMLQGNDGTMTDNVVSVARTVDGVAWSSPLIMSAAQVKLPAGGNQAITVIGSELPDLHGGPIHVVAGDPQSLSAPDSMFFEDSRREILGSINRGSVREVNGHAVTVVGFTYGLIPFNPPLAFASYDTAREILGRGEHDVSYVMVGLKPGADAAKVRDAMSKIFPDQLVLTKAQLHDRTNAYIIKQSGIGGMIGSGVLMAVICGFVIVALMMFSSVVENLREFGTLKAIGATNKDLAKLLVTQAVTAGVIGVLLGETGVHWLFAAVKNPEMLLGQQWWMLVVTLIGMTGMCVLASTLALLRVRSVEPAMVFRG